MRANRLAALILTLVITSANIPAALASDEQQERECPYSDSNGAAVVSSIVYVPAKAGACALSGVLWLAEMALTGGSKYQQAGDFVHDVCTGKWVIKGQDMDKKRDFFLED